MILRALCFYYFLFLFVESRHFTKKSVKWLQSVNDDVSSEQTTSPPQNGVGKTVQLRSSEQKELNQNHLLECNFSTKLGEAKTKSYQQWKSALAIKNERVTESKLKASSKLESKITIEMSIKSEVESEVKSRDKAKRGSETSLEEDVKCKMHIERVTQIRADRQNGPENGTEIKVHDITKSQLAIELKLKSQVEVKGRNHLGWKEKSKVGKERVVKRLVKLKSEAEEEGNGENTGKSELKIREQAEVAVEIRSHLKSNLRVEVLKSKLEANMFKEEEEKKETQVLKTRATFTKSLTNAFRRSASSLFSPGGVVDSGIRTVKPFMDWVKTTCSSLPIDQNFLVKTYRRLISGTDSEVKNGVPHSVPRSRSPITNPPDLRLKTLANSIEVKISSGRHEDAFEVPVDLEFADAQTTLPESPPRRKRTNGERGREFEDWETLEIAEPARHTTVYGTPPQSPRRSPKRLTLIPPKGPPTETQKESPRKSSPISLKQSPKNSLTTDRMESDRGESLNWEYKRVVNAKDGADSREAKSPQRSPKRSPQQPKQPSLRSQRESPQRSQTETLQKPPSKKENGGNWGEFPRKSPKKSPQRSPQVSRKSPTKKNGQSRGAVDDRFMLPKLAINPGFSRWREMRTSSRAKKKDAAQDEAADDGAETQPLDTVAELPPLRDNYTVSELAAWAREAFLRLQKKTKKGDGGEESGAEGRASPAKKNGKPLPEADAPDPFDLRNEYTANELANWAEAKAAKEPSRGAGGSQGARIELTASELEQKRRQMIGVPSSRFKGDAKFHDPKAWEMITPETTEDNAPE